MNARRFFEMSASILFFFWYMVLMIIMGYIYFANRGAITFQTNVFTTMIVANLITGLSTVISGLLYIILLLFKKIIKQLLIFGAIIITIIFSLALFPGNGTQHLPPSQKLKNTLFELKNTYSAIFFEFFGFPSDSSFVTPSSLLQKVNAYRKSRGLNELEEQNETCNISQDRLSRFLSVSYTTHVQKVSRFPVENGAYVSRAAEILQSFDRFINAHSIIDYVWTKPFSETKSILDTPDWQFFCARVSGFTVSSIFAK